MEEGRYTMFDIFVKKIVADGVWYRHKKVHQCDGE